MENLSKEHIAFSINCLEFVRVKLHYLSEELCNYTSRIHLGIRDFDAESLTKFYEGMFKSAYNTTSFRRSIGKTIEHAPIVSDLCNGVCLAINDFINYKRRLVEYLDKNKHNLKYTVKDCEAHVNRLNREINQLSNYKAEVKQFKTDTSVFKNIENILKFAEATDSKYRLYETLTQYTIMVKAELDREIGMLDDSKEALSHLLV